MKRDASSNRVRSEVCVINLPKKPNIIEIQHRCVVIGCSISRVLTKLHSFLYSLKTRPGSWPVIIYKNNKWTHWSLLGARSLPLEPDGREVVDPLVR